MAIKELTIAKGKLNKFMPFAFEKATKAADGFQVNVHRENDECMVVLVHNTDEAARSFTVKKPDSGCYYAASVDEVYQVPAGEMAFFRFEKAKWVNKKGIITFIPETAAVKVAVLG